MKKYSVFDLRVIEIGNDDNLLYLICKPTSVPDIYIEVLTKKKVYIKQDTFVQSLSVYYPVSQRMCYINDEPLMLDKEGILKKYIEINNYYVKRKVEFEIENHIHHTVKEERGGKPLKSSIITRALEKDVETFFPNTGRWTSSCFKRPDGLSKCNLPCHLDDDIWLARMFRADKNIFYISFASIVNFIKTNEVFLEKKHDYAMEIIKWQINWMLNDGENWICDEEYGGDFVFMTPVCDLGFRKGVVDTLTKIGMSRETVEEGIEMHSDLWRDRMMNAAFRNEFDPVFYSIYGNNEEKKLSPIDPEHQEKWIMMRKYQYYKQHKDSVDKYGGIEHAMVMKDEELKQVSEYLVTKNAERLQEIEERTGRKQNNGYSNVIKKEHK